MKGFIAVHQPFPFTSSLHFVDEIFVKKMHRRKGYATALLNEFLTGPMELRVHMDNNNAIALYTKLDSAKYSLIQAVRLPMRSRRDVRTQKPNNPNISV